MRIAIVGSRYWDDYELAEKTVREFVRTLPRDTVVVSGAAKGVDSWAVSEAENCGLGFDEIPVPNKGSYRSRSDFAIAAKGRNTTIVELSDEVVAFWNGHSGGTLDSINKAKRMGKRVRVFSVGGDE